MTTTVFEDPFSEEVWKITYKDHNDDTIDDTLKRVATFVASAEDAPYEQDEWEEKFYEMLSDFKCTAGGRIYANAGTEFGGTTLMNCFNPEVKVQTLSGLKPICDVEVGDYVLTHKGRFRPVINTLVRPYSGPVQRFKSAYQTGDIVSTPEHPFYQGGGNWKESKNVSNVVLLSQQQNNAGEIIIDLSEMLAQYSTNIVVEEDFIYTTKTYIGGNVAVGTKQGHKVKRFIVVDRDFAYLLGCFVGDGCTFKNNQTTLFEVDAFNIAFNTITEQDRVQLIIDIFNKTFGVVPNIISSQNNTTYVRKASQITAQVLRMLVGEGYQTKNIPEIIWNSSVEIKQSFLLGLYDADGFVTKRGALLIEMSNPSLITQVQSMMMQAGVPCTNNNNRLFAGAHVSADFRDQMGKFYKDDRLTFVPSKKPSTGPVELLEGGFSIIPERIEEDYEGYVYNLSVEEDESYIVNNVVVHNCFVSPRNGPDIDSLPKIVEDILNQCQTLKSEGGWGQNFSWIRPRGAFIHGIGVETPGAVKYMEIYDKTSDVITSGSGSKSKNKKAKGRIRKGAMMSVLDCWHPDIIEFITAKQQPGRLTKFNVSVNCTDDFMEAVKNDQEWDLRFPDTTFENYKGEWDGNLKKWEEKGYPVKVYRTVSATWLWNLILESTYNRAEPGVLFLDRANHFNPLNYFETIAATNPCLVGDTLIPTQNGLICLDELVDQFEGGNPVECLSSDLKGTLCFRAISNVVRSGVKQTITLHLSNGMQITSTPDHKFWTGSEWCEARLCQGKMFDLVSQYRFSDNYDFNFEFCSTYTGKNNREYFTNLPTKWTEDLALVLGWLVGDGWITDTGAGFIFGKDDQEMCERFRRIFNKWGCSVSEVVDNHHSITLYLTSSVVKQLFENLGVLKVKSSEKRVPSSIFKSPKNIVSSFLRGLFSADGSVLEMKNSNFWVSLCSSSRLLLNDVQHLLLMYGITHHKTYDINKTSVFKYTTVRGEERQYIGNTYHDLRIYGHGIITFFEEIGFSLTRKHQMLSNIQGKRFKKKQPSVVVVDIEEAGPKDVYDITEPVFHNFVANGVVVHNCGEQTLASGGVCNLGSINLTQFVLEDGSGFDLEKIKKYVRYLNRFLDNINSLSSAPLPEYVDSMRMKRRVGIGILGWGSALFMMKTRFGSRRASDLREQVMSTIACEAYMSSIDLAEEKGMFKYCDPDSHANNSFVKSLNLPIAYIDKLRKVGIRNSSLLSIQPTGNTSIFANIASGGLEPIFLPEYVRTVIVGEMPEHIADVTPKWYESEWHETEMFKFTKEGDEEILKGVDSSGVVYKIDKNRGLTKEVICEDYGVRWLKARDEWDPKARWAVTTANMSVKDHINDLKGFARWVDSAMSKTVNVPYDYPFEDFKDIYLEAYNSGFVKGVTTYRSGTMTTVLSAKEDRMADSSDEEIILDDVKVPTQAPAVVNTIRGDGKKWYLTTIMDDQQRRPIAFFVHTNHHEKTVTTHDAVEYLIQLAKDKRIPARWIYETIVKMEKDTNATKIARAISLNLRHGVLIKNVVSVLDRVENVFVGSFLFQIKKYLATFIKDGEKVEGEKCLECGSENIVFSEGCKKCMSCGSSKCG